MIGAIPPTRLVDLKMPGLDGWGVIERLKRHPAPPPLVVMSGWGAESRPSFARSVGSLYGYLQALRPRTARQDCSRASPGPSRSALDNGIRGPPQLARRESARSRRALSQEATAGRLGRYSISSGGAQFDWEPPPARTEWTSPSRSGRANVPSSDRADPMEEGWQVGLQFTEMSPTTRSARNLLTPASERPVRVKGSPGGGILRHVVKTV